MEKEVKLSARDLAEYTEQSGDIGDRFRNMLDRAKESRKIRKMIQKKYNIGLLPETTFKNTTLYKSINYIVEGRADEIGIKNGKTLIDEIKSTTHNLEELEYNPNEYHWAQVKCYRYFYALNNDLEDIDLQLTYYQTDIRKIKSTRQNFTFEELKEFHSSLLERYSVFTKLITQHMKDRDESIQDLSFPRPAFRVGQKYLNQNVYSVTKQGVDLMVEAATGIGETVPTLSPSVKAMGEGFTDKIFYLAAKSTLKKTHNGQLYLMKQRGLVIKSVEIIAENKVCINDEVKYNPDDCEFAKDHYDKVNERIFDMLEDKDIITEEIIRKYTLKYRMYSSELELDLSNLRDIMICDYNYVFNLVVYLRRLFEAPYLRMSLLVDEAHNLVNRGCNVYSYSLSFSQLMDCCDELVGDKKELEIKHNLKKVVKQIKDKALGKPINAYEGLSADLTDYCTCYKESVTKFLAEEESKPYYDEVSDVYFEINKFLKILDFYNDFSVTLTESENDDVIYNIMCLNTHNAFKNPLREYKSNVLFSATLSLMTYFTDVLGLEKFYNTKLESFLPEENLKVNRTSISARFRDREGMRYKITGILRKTNEKSGNKLVFFPSYSYLESVYEICDFDILTQERTLIDMGRLEFLSQFTTSSDVVTFCVLDGAFNGGADLSGDRLNTAGIISAGFPGVSVEDGLIKKYFDENEKNEFGCAYVYPGISKVHRAGGRLIRTDTNTGELFLIGDRFDSYPYKSLLPNN